MTKWIRWVSYLYRAGLLCYLPCVCILPLYIEDTGWWQSPYGFRAVGFLLMTLPFLGVYVEAGYVIAEWSGRKARTTGQRLVDTVTPVAVVIATVFYLLSAAGVLNVRAWIYYLFLLCLLWVPIAWVLRVTMWKKRLHIREWFGHREIWILALIFCGLILVGGLSVCHIRDLGFRWSHRQGWYNIQDDLPI